MRIVNQSMLLNNWRGSAVEVDIKTSGRAVGDVTSFACVENARRAEVVEANMIGNLAANALYRAAFYRKPEHT